MKYLKLGNTGTVIPAIGQGTMGIGGYLTRDTGRDDAQVNALRLGIELGMTFIDTAEVYGEGHAEELVAEAVRGARDKVFIASKFLPEHNACDAVLQAAEGSLRRLRTDYIDLYQLHWPNPATPLGDTMRALECLINDGKIRFVGVSNLSFKELKEARRAVPSCPVVSLQIEYNLFDRTIENVILPYCQGQGITVIAYSPLDQGKVASGSERINLLRQIAERHRKTISQVALNWLVSHEGVMAIPKASSPEHIRQNAGATDFTLSAGEITGINEAFAPECVCVPTDRVCVIPGGQGNRKVYRTVDEALENRLGFVPSPADLARDILDGEILKPVRVLKSDDETGRYDYDLVEGRIRYWAWVIAHKGKEPIPVLIRED
jgi:diketogulonate reductase-like aldo/keto reductase